MKVTEKLRKWLVDESILTADEAKDDSACKAAAGEAMLSGKLTKEKAVELQKDEDATNADALGQTLKAVLEGQTKLLNRIEALEAGDTPVELEESKETTTEAKVTSEAQNKLASVGLIPAMTGGDGSSVGDVKVHGAHERYSKQRDALKYPTELGNGRKHPFAGQDVFENIGGASGATRRKLSEPSDLDMAVNGAYFKWAMQMQLGQKCPPPLRMNEHEQELMAYALKEVAWTGIIGGVGSESDNAMVVRNAKLTAHQQKAILDDAGSGGLELAPIAFDDAVIMTPQLFGEFFPSINVINVARGRRMEGGSMGNVTLSSGGADGTSIPLFSTASFISAFDTSIFVVNGAIEIGLDFLSDSPIDVAGEVTRQYGETLLNWLDTQIVSGDGTTEPEGIMNASGTTSVSSANGAGGGPTVGDYEGLLFGVDKQFKQRFDANRIMYGANETTYSRARGIAVGGSDARRVFGMNQEDYSLFGHPYGINASFTNQQIFFGNMARYRMYRRMGLTMNVTTEGKTLVRDNLMLISARARFGGQIEDGNAFAVMTDAQS